MRRRKKIRPGEDRVRLTEEAEQILDAMTLSIMRKEQQKKIEPEKPGSNDQGEKK